jgi:hypothetical protein
MAKKFTVDISSRLTRLAIPDAAEIPPAVLEAIRRQAILEDWARQERAVGPVAALRKVMRKLRRAGRPQGYSTLYRWQRLFNRSGFAGLIDGRNRKGPQAAMDETCRALLADHLERLNSQGLAILAVIAAMLATRKGTQKPKPKKAIQTEIEPASKSV